MSSPISPTSSWGQVPWLDKCRLCPRTWIDEHLDRDLVECSWFSIQCDESLDINSILQLIIFRSGEKRTIGNAGVLCWLYYVVQRWHRLPIISTLSLNHSLASDMCNRESNDSCCEDHEQHLFQSHNNNVGYSMLLEESAVKYGDLLPRTDYTQISTDIDRQIWLKSKSSWSPKGKTLRCSRTPSGYLTIIFNRHPWETEPFKVPVWSLWIHLFWHELHQEQTQDTGYWCTSTRGAVSNYTPRLQCIQWNSTLLKLIC